MSLTPCIYPMISITVGLLQPSSTNSVIKNFLHAFTYTLGLATTFALLGLVVVSGAIHFGIFFSSPLFIVLFIILLGYLALSLFDFYTLRLPRFLLNKSPATHPRG